MKKAAWSFAADSACDGMAVPLLLWPLRVSL
jgi:hypothetical protein